jgi:hypothetical protein
MRDASTRETPETPETPEIKGLGSTIEYSISLPLIVQSHQGETEPQQCLHLWDECTKPEPDPQNRLADDYRAFNDSSQQNPDI